MLVAFASVTVNAAFSQVSAVAAPASAVGESVTVSAFVSIALAQVPLPSMVNVNVTIVPASDAIGVYVGVKVVELANVPSPSWVHWIPPLVELAPLTVNAVFSQVSAVAAPASAVGESVTVSDFVSEALAQLPLPLIVNVNITVVPASVVAGV